MNKILGWLFAAAFAAGGAGASGAAELSLPGSGAEVAAELPPLPEVSPDGVDLGALRDRAIAVADDFPALDYDVQALAEYFAADPAAAFAYVRDLNLDPYQGVLRGPAGVLGARGGSSADKAVLLVELLRAMGIEARFVFGTLDPEMVPWLRARAIAPRVRNPAESTLPGLAGLSEAAVERLAARAHRDFAWLRTAVGDRLTPSADLQPSPRHVWVQALIDGTWTDLDPSLTMNDVGETIATPGTTADAIPEQLIHAVQLTLVAESLIDGRLVTATALDHRLAAADAGERHIFLSFSPDGGGTGALGGAILGSFGVDLAYLPVLMIGDEVAQGSPLPLLPDGASTEDSMFGDDAGEFFFGEEQATGVGAAPELVALYLDVTVQSPWAAPETRRRVLLDRVEPTQRAAGAVDAASLVPVEAMDGVPAAYAAVHQIVVSTGGGNPHQTAVGIAAAAEFIGSRMASPEALAELSLPEVLWPIGALNASLVLASEELAVEPLNDINGLYFYVGTPRVFLLSFQPAAVSGHAGLQFAIDLLHDGVAAVGNPDIPAPAVAERMMWYGVVQSALETTMAELRASGFVEEGRQVVSTSTEMTPDLAVLGPADAGIAAPPMLTAALDDGNLVIANAGTVAPNLQTWWTIDPVDGSTRAIWAPGLGGSGGGGFRLPGSYTNATPNMGDRIIVDPRTGNNVGFSRGGRDYYYRNGPRGGTCRGGNEYSTILGCVSLPAGMALGTAYAIVIGEVVFFAALVIYSAT